MTQKAWYVYQNSTQSGPMTRDALIKMIQDSSIQANALLFKTGWKAWKPYQECEDEFKPALPSPAFHTSSTNTQSRLSFANAVEESSILEPIQQKRAPRASVDGQIIVHNNDNLMFAKSANISAEGVFVKTDKPIFNIGEILKLTCRIQAIGAPFNAEAQVVRRATGPSEPSGYGLFFTSIKPEIADRIREVTRTFKAAN